MGGEGLRKAGPRGRRAQLRRDRRRPGEPASRRGPGARPPARSGAARPCRPRRPTSSSASPPRMLEGQGDLLPVSALPVDGTFPTGTSRWEKRDIAQEIPIWDPSICIDCGKCALACPHAAIRMQVYPPEALAGAPDTFPSKEFVSRDLPGHAADHPGGAGRLHGVRRVRGRLPGARARRRSSTRPSTSSRRAGIASASATNFDFFLTLPSPQDDRLPADTIKGSQVRQPLFEFSGACAGCGETPYLKLLTQLFGDRIIVANATGCSSIYGGNLPTTPWATDRGGARPGVGQLAVRGQRRVRAGAPARARAPGRRTPARLLARLAVAAAGGHGRRPSCPRPQSERRGGGGAARASRRAEARAAGRRRRLGRATRGTC